MQLYLFADRDQWGIEIQHELRQIGSDGQMVTHPAQVEDSVGQVVFVHVPDSPEQARKYSAAYVTAMGVKPNVKIVPSLAEVAYAGDKVLQFKMMGNWMPPTWFFSSPEDVFNIVNQFAYPIISKSHHGVHGQDNRVLAGPAQAFKEAMRVFGKDGLTLPSGRKQQGYVLWQTYVMGPREHYRVVMLDQQYAAVVERRCAGIHEGQITDMNDVRPVDVVDEKVRKLLEYVWGFCDEFDLRFACVDFKVGTDIQTNESHGYIIDVGVDWPMWWFQQGGMIFERRSGVGWESCGVPASKMYMVIAERLRDGGFQYRDGDKSMPVVPGYGGAAGSPVRPVGGK